MASNSRLAATSGGVVAGALIAVGVPAVAAGGPRANIRATAVEPRIQPGGNPRVRTAVRAGSLTATGIVAVRRARANPRSDHVHRAAVGRQDP